MTSEDQELVAKIDEWNGSALPLELERESPKSHRAKSALAASPSGRRPTPKSTRTSGGSNNFG